MKMAKFLNTSTDYLLGLTDMKLPYNKIALDKLSSEEFAIIAQYRNLSSPKKSKLCGYLDALSDI